MSDKKKDLTEEELAQATGGRRTRRTSETLNEGTLPEAETEPEPTKPKPKITGVSGIGDPTYQ